MDNNIICPMPVGIGIGELPFLSVLCRYKKVIVQCFNNTESIRRASILKYVANDIQIVDKYSEINTIESFHGKYNNEHFCKDLLSRVQDLSGEENLIPYVKLSKSEIDYGLKFCSKFDKPVIIFNPIPGGYHLTCPTALYKMLDFKKWEEILFELSKKYTIIHVSRFENSIDFPYTIKNEDLSLNMRKLIAVLRISGKYVGIESGMLHLAIAAGAFCFSIIPHNDGYHNGINWQNWIYTEDMWKFEPCRIKYYIFDEYKNILNDL
jgi:hypothetical protein